MGRKKYQRYGKEFKREALMLLESSGKSVAEIEDDLGLTKGILYKWKYRYQVVEDKAGKKKVAPSELAEAQAEVRRLRRAARNGAAGARNFKKGSHLLRQPEGVRYEFIEGWRTVHQVKLMCRVMEVTRSGYYAWRKRGMSQRKREDKMVMVDIQQVFDESRKTYGSPRIYAMLHRKGWRVSRKRVARLMREAGLVARQRTRRRPVTTQWDGSHPVVPNRLNRDFTAQEPEQTWVSDIIYIDTAEGWLYLAVVLDLFSHKVVGWSMAPHLRASFWLKMLCL